MKLWPSSYHAKYEPDPSSDLAIIAPEIWDLYLKVIS